MSWSQCELGWGEAIGEDGSRSLEGGRDGGGGWEMACPGTLEGDLTQVRARYPDLAGAQDVESHHPGRSLQTFQGGS